MTLVYSYKPVILATSVVTSSTPTKLMTNNISFIITK